MLADASLDDRRRTAQPAITSAPQSASFYSMFAAVNCSCLSQMEVVKRSRLVIPN